MKLIGLIVNPIAGMGGAVGLKGTDGNIYVEALKLGAKSVAPEKAKQFLSNIKSEGELFILAALGGMGENIVKKSRHTYDPVEFLPAWYTLVSYGWRIVLASDVHLQLNI